ncbi:MAG: sterol carrier protein domain-containing protein, partial [Candidatus Kariarchaeaceae archaeon]
EAVKGDESILMDLQQTSIKEGSRLYLSEESIKKRVKSHNCYIVEEDGKPAGWFKLYFHRDKTEIDWEDQKLTMTVSLTIFYNNHKVLNGIFDFLSKFEDQVHEIRMNSASEIPVSYYIENRHKLKIETRGSMMIRVIDLKQYIGAIQIPKSAKRAIVLNLEDEHCPWNSGTYNFTPNNGKLILTETDVKAEIKVNDQEFSKIVSGLYSITTLQSLGILDCAIDVAQKLKAIFPEDPVMSYQRF